MAPTDRVHTLAELPVQANPLVYLLMPLSLLLFVFLIRRYAVSRLSARINQHEPTSVVQQEKAVDDGSRNDARFTTGAHTISNIHNREYDDLPMPSARILHDQNETFTDEPQTYELPASGEASRQQETDSGASSNCPGEASLMGYWQMQKTIDYNTSPTHRDGPHSCTFPMTESEREQPQRHAMIRRETTQVFPGSDKRQYSRRRILEFS